VAEVDVSNTRIPIEYELLKSVVALDLKTIDTKIESLDGEIVHVKMILQEDPEILASCGWVPTRRCSRRQDCL
jgi:hypothetical protein